MRRAQDLITRRRVLGAAAVGIAGYGAWRGGLVDRFIAPPDFDFRDLEHLDGYRILKAGAITGGGVPLFGLDSPDGPKSTALIETEALIRDDLCGVLFDEPGDRTKVSLAYFYDYQCPICQRLTPMLRAREDINMTWHDLAGLGPASETAARAAIAARAQGAFDAFHDRLMRARFQATDGYVATLAESAGIDADRLLIDMASPQTSQRLLVSQLLARQLAMPGTPGLVVGRTVVIGDISASDLTRLVAIEAAEGKAC